MHDLIVPLALWQAASGMLLAHPGRIGIRLESGEEPSLIADSLQAFGLIAVHFPHFTDGRGYTTARLLRERYGWRGELRATLTTVVPELDAAIGVSAAFLCGGLFALLVRLHAHVETLATPAARELDAAIWRELAAGSARRKLSLGAF